MIVSLHVATGAAAGVLARSRRQALLIGPFLHLLGDRVPHEDIASRRFEITSGAAALLLLAACRGPFDAAIVGAASASAPDLEHVVPLVRPRGRKLFHGRASWHRSGGLPAPAQLLIAGATIGLLLTCGRRDERAKPPMSA